MGKHLLRIFVTQVLILLQIFLTEAFSRTDFSTIYGESGTPSVLREPSAAAGRGGGSYLWSLCEVASRGGEKGGLSKCGEKGEG